MTSGFELTPLKVYFLGEHEIYGFARKRKGVSPRRQMDLFADLKPGDLVVHDVHGKGRFIGLVKREVQKVSRDYLELEYRDGDKLFIPTDQIDRVQKYMGGDNERLSKLGGREWAQTKARVKKAVKELAEDLISIYSERMFKKGHKYGEDTIWQRQFEDSFPYEETEGQLKSIAEIQEGHAAGKGDGPPAAGRRGLRQDRGGDARLLQGRDGGAAVRGAGAYHAAGPAALSYVSGAV